MNRGSVFLVGALAAIVIAVPVMAGVGPDLPQLDPRNVGWESGGHLALAQDGDQFYIVEHDVDCAATGSGADELCIWGPVTLEDMSSHPGASPVPDAPLLASFTADLGSVPSLAATVRAGMVQAAAFTDSDVLVAEASTAGSTTSLFSTDAPCEAPAVFDSSDPILWFACGPTALFYQTGALTLYPGNFDVVVERPGGGVVGLLGGAEPTIGVFDLASGDLYMPDEVPDGAVMLGAATDSTRGIAMLFQTPCDGPCVQDPADPSDLLVDPADLVDFSVAWIGWDGAIEETFGVAPAGTGPPRPGTSPDVTVDTDGEIVVISQPYRTVGLAPDADVNLWQLLEADGTRRAPFTGQGNATLELHVAWGGLVHLGFIDGQAELTFWHLSDQGRFFDDAGQFEDEIEALATAGVTLGCNPDGTLFCPGDPVTRAQMASFIARWLGLTLDKPDAFADDDGSTHEASINAIADAGISLGCSGTDPTAFCPDDLVSRAQMASFIARALGLPDDLSNRFSDDDGSTHERAIDAIATLGVTLGCDAGQPELYCPDDHVLRQQMAAFLDRAGL